MQKIIENGTEMEVTNNVAGELSRLGKIYLCPDEECHGVYHIDNDLINSKGHEGAWAVIEKIAGRY